VDQGIAEKVIVKMRIIEAGRASSGGTRKNGVASASGYCERLGALMHVQFGSNRSILQICTIIYNDERLSAVWLKRISLVVY
jgi:hypothetical protein